MKLCKDCKHARPERNFLFMENYEFAVCHSPNQERSLVDGHIHPEFLEIVRREYGGCGPEAQWFEPKDAK